MATRKELWREALSQYSNDLSIDFNKDIKLADKLTTVGDLEDFISKCDDDNLNLIGKSGYAYNFIESVTEHEDWDWPHNCGLDDDDPQLSNDGRFYYLDSLTINLGTRDDDELEEEEEEVDIWAPWRRLFS